MHTNDAATTVPRLLDLGVEPYLVASTVTIIIAQRLVRRICVKCRISYELDILKLKQLPEEFPATSLELLRKFFPDEKTVRLYKGKGCEVCHQTGYVGREGIYEVLSVDSDIRNAINQKADANIIEKIALKNGMVSMLQNGIQKVREGITTIDELLRVTTE